MRNTRKASVGFAVAVLLTAAVACHSDSTTPSTTSQPAASAAESSPAPSAQQTDYAKLLINPEDIDAPETFSATAPTLNPGGKEGVSTTFSNDDRTHVIIDTIVIYPDPDAAAAALDTEKTQLPEGRTATPKRVDVGTGGTSVSGDSPDGSKGVTVLRFTQGRAFVTIQFDGPPGMSAPPDFVADVGQKQDDAIKKGLTD